MPASQKEERKVTQTVLNLKYGTILKTPILLALRVTVRINWQSGAEEREAYKLHGTLAQS